MDNVVELMSRGQSYLTADVRLLVTDCNVNHRCREQIVTARWLVCRATLGRLTGPWAARPVVPSHVGWGVCWAGLLVVLWASSGWAQDASSENVPSTASSPTVEIEFNSPDGQTAPSGKVLGEVLLRYEDASMLLLTEDGQLWTLKTDDILSVTPSTRPMQPLSSDQIYERFKGQLPSGFGIYKTKNYVLIYNTSDIYVKWVAELFERLHRNFYNYWKSKGFKLSEPRFPLVAVVFSNKASYMSYAQREIGDTAEAMIGYYNMKTNRMVTYDLTGVDGLVPSGTRVSSDAVIRHILSQPQAERTVATIVHEASHQLAYNSGLQVRLADNPLWLSEGLAMFFETPDASSSKGWGGVGKVNTHNLRLFAQYVPNRPADSLLTLISSDKRLREAATAGQAYPESWALTYFLLNAKSKQFIAYLKELAQQPPLGEVTPRERIELFKRHFGEDLEVLDRELMNFYRRRG
jgi:hypothetical protein